MYVEVLGTQRDPPAAVVPVGDGRLQPLWHATAEGRPVAPVAPRRGGGTDGYLLDTELDEICTVQRAPDDAYRCMPVPRYGTFCFADATCTEPAFCVQDVGDDLSRFAYQADQGLPVPYEIGARLDRTFGFVGGGDECVEQLDRPAYAIEVVPSGRFVEAELVRP